jgi:hypothetical protein
MLIRAPQVAPVILRLEVLIRLTPSLQRKHDSINDLMIANNGARVFVNCLERLFEMTQANQDETEGFKCGARQ